MIIIFCFSYFQFNAQKKIGNLKKQATGLIPLQYLSDLCAQEVIYYGFIDSHIGSGSQTALFMAVYDKS